MAKLALAEKKKKPQAQQPLFKEREDGILEYCGAIEPPSEEDEDKGAEWQAVEAWQGLDATKDESTWAQASIAASIQPVYGKETMKTFGSRIGQTPQHLKRIARTYKYFTESEHRCSNPKIYFGHHILAMRHDDPAKALRIAAENGWSTRALEDWISRRTSKEAASADVSEETLNALMVWNEHVEEIIEEDFIANCPDRKYALRVFGPWLEDIRGENKRLYLDDLRVIVIDAIENSGAQTIQELILKTGKKRSDIEAVVSSLIREEEYEWIQKRGETEEARGMVKNILHKFGAAHGGGYNAPRAHDPNMGGNSNWD